MHCFVIGTVGTSERSKTKQGDPSRAVPSRTGTRRRRLFYGRVTLVGRTSKKQETKGEKRGVGSVAIRDPPVVGRFPCVPTRESEGGFSQTVRSGSRRSNLRRALPGAQRLENFGTSHLFECALVETRSPLEPSVGRVEHSPATPVHALTLVESPRCPTSSRRRMLKTRTHPVKTGGRKVSKGESCIRYPRFLFRSSQVGILCASRAARRNRWIEGQV